MRRTTPDMKKIPFSDAEPTFNDVERTFNVAERRFNVAERNILLSLETFFFKGRK